MSSSVSWELMGALGMKTEKGDGDGGKKEKGVDFESF